MTTLKNMMSHKTQPRHGLVTKIDIDGKIIKIKAKMSLWVDDATTTGHPIEALFSTRSENGRCRSMHMHNFNLYVNSCQVYTMLYLRNIMYLIKGEPGNLFGLFKGTLSWGHGPDDKYVILFTSQLDGLCYSEDLKARLDSAGPEFMFQDHDVTIENIVEVKSITSDRFCAKHAGKFINYFYFEE